MSKLIYYQSLKVELWFVSIQLWLWFTKNKKQVSNLYNIYFNHWNKLSTKTILAFKIVYIYTFFYLQKKKCFRLALLYSKSLKKQRISISASDAVDLLTWPINCQNQLASVRQARCCPTERQPSIQTRTIYPQRQISVMLTSGFFKRFSEQENW